MEVVSTAINAAVVSAVGLILARLGKGSFQALNGRMDRLEQRLDHRIDTLQASVDAMRSDLTQVALAVGVRGKASNA